MSQPANDDYSQHLSDDEASYHEDASDSEIMLLKRRERLDRTILLMGIFQDNLRKIFMEWMMLKEIWEAIWSRFGAWSNLAMTMRTKPDVDTLSIDDLYNNLRVFEQELTILLTLLSSNNIKKESSMLVFADEVTLFTNFAKITSDDLDLLQEDLETALMIVDIEEMDIKWQIALIDIQMKKFYKEVWKKSQD
ncbi:hypothetical protein Tco_0079352 [Tanacetum coccineum]